MASCVLGVDVAMQFNHLHVLLMPLLLSMGWGIGPFGVGGRAPVGGTAHPLGTGWEGEGLFLGGELPSEARHLNRLHVTAAGCTDDTATEAWHQARAGRLSTTQALQHRGPCSRQQMRARRSELLPYEQGPPAWLQGGGHKNVWVGNCLATQLCTGTCNQPGSSGRGLARSFECPHPAARATGLVVNDTTGRRRLAAVAPLADVLQVQLQLEERAHPIQLAGGHASVLISVDATCLWQSTATRGDVLLMLPQGQRKPWQPTSWSTWFVMDGPEGGRALQALDAQASLSSQVQAAQRAWQLLDVQGANSHALCFLTGDGKAMQTMTPGEGRQCWNCNARVQELSCLTPVPEIEQHVRSGAFLPDIPPCRRVGDVVHATARVTTAMVKRLGTSFGGGERPLCETAEGFYSGSAAAGPGAPGQCQAHCSAGHPGHL